MDNKINELEERYRNEIKLIFNELARERWPDMTVRYHGSFGNEISELFQLTGYRDYEDYVDILNKLQEYNPELAVELEEYLSKEMNLIALLSLHACLDKLPLSK